MSVSQRMRQYTLNQKEQQAIESLDRIEAMTLEELSKEKIAFGTAHVGETFPEAFEFHGWVDWFTSRYEKSPKPAHRKFVRYVELRLDTLEEPGPSKAAKDKKKPTGSQKPLTPPPVTETDQISEDEWENMSSTVQMADMQEQMTNMNQANLQLHHRVNNMEMAMQEILEHVRKMTIKSET